jgi:bifunctional non-homologous end joining protein LigD
LPDLASPAVWAGLIAAFLGGLAGGFSDSGGAMIFVPVAASERPPSGPGWLHEIKFDDYRVIARKDGERVRLWARTTSDYSKALSRIHDAVAALPVDSAVIDGEAILLRPDNSFDFEALRSRQGQAEAILVAYDVMEVDGQDIRPEPLEERRKRLAKLLSRKTKAMRDGIQVSEAITGDGATIFRHACGMDREGIVSVASDTIRRGLEF